MQYIYYVKLWIQLCTEVLHPPLVSHSVVKGGYFRTSACLEWGPDTTLTPGDTRACLSSEPAVVKLVRLPWGSIEIGNDEERHRAQPWLLS